MARRTFDAETLDALLDIALPGTVQMAMGMLADVWGLTDVTPTQEVNWRKYTAQMVDAGAVYSVVNVVWHRSGEVEGTCSCGGVLCAHQVAVILTLSESHGLRLEGAASVRRPAPGWKDILDQYLPQHSTLGADVARPEDIIEPTPVCLFFRCEDDEVSIRPGERGKTGSWIKGKAGWGNVFEMDLDMRVLEVFDEFADLNYTQSLPQNSFGGLDFTYGIGGYRPTRRHEWLSLHALPAGGLWEKLRTLRDAGVEMISWEGRGQVALPDEAAQVRMSVTGDSDLALRAELLYGGRATEDDPMTTHVFLGDPMDVIAETRVARGSDKRRGATGAVRAADVAQVVALRQLPEPPSPEAVSLLTDVDTLHVAASDRAEFERDFLPRIRGLMSVESPDGSYIQPEPLPPVLVLEVNPLVDKDGMLVRVRLGWRWDRSSGILDSEHERAVAASVRDLGVEPVEQTLAREQAVPFLAETLGLLDALDYVRTQVTADVPQFRAAQDAPSVRIGTGGTGQDGTDWLDLFVTVTIGGEEVNFVDLFTALNRDEEIFVLPSGTYFRLDTPELEQLHRIICEARTLNDVTVDGLRISRYQVDMWAELVESGIVDAQANEWWSRVEALARGGGEDGTVALDGRDIDVPADLQATLRDYQCYGFRWLETLRRNNLGGILADDMGLGKTLQVIAMMLAAQQDAPAPFLVVAPTSVVGNWVREVEKFAPSLTVVGIDRTEKKLGCTVVDEIGGAQVVVTSYTLFRLDAESYNSLEWAGAVFDEAQMIKNHTSRAYACARKLDAPLKIAVTGTPMENNLLELWALSSLVCPGLLGSKRHFEEFFRFPVEKGQDAERLALLQRRLRPFLMRRTKEKVADDLPAKTENVLELDLYPKHRQIYERRLQRERQKLLGLVDDMNANRFEVFRTLTLLRQLALDSELAGEASSPSAKLDTLADLLANATQEGHRVLVLSQFTRFLSKARDAATAAGIDSLYLDGKTRGRQKLIDSFSDGDGAPVFFISLKAGGFGLNLTEADYVVLLDPWWNPATEAQAVDRAHRIGQTRSVMVYRLVSADTIESKVMDLKTSKAALFDRVLDGGGTVETDGLSVEDIRSLVE